MQQTLKPGCKNCIDRVAEIAILLAFFEGVDTARHSGNRGGGTPLPGRLDRPAPGSAAPVIVGNPCFVEKYTITTSSAYRLPLIDRLC
jgi:hypothetical protein